MTWLMAGSVPHLMTMDAPADASGAGEPAELVDAFVPCGDSPTGSCASASRVAAPALSLEDGLQALLMSGEWGTLQNRIRANLGEVTGWALSRRPVPDAALADATRAWLNVRSLQSGHTVLLYETVRAGLNGKTSVSDEDLQRCLLAILMFRLRTFQDDACCRVVLHDGTLITGRYGATADAPWKLAKVRFAEWVSGVARAIPGKFNFSGLDHNIVALFRESLAAMDRDNRQYAYWLAGYSHSMWTQGITFGNIPKAKIAACMTDPNPATTTRICDEIEAQCLADLATCPSWHAFFADPKW